MNYVYLLLGSNLGDSKLYIDKAVGLIFRNVGEVVKESSLYESPPWGFSHENSFLNKVLLIKTDFEVDKVLDECQLIEKELGRVRLNSIEYLAREIDIDILFYNNDIIESKKLSVPHPRIWERRFTLLPLCEIAERFVHPVLKMTISDLLKECTDYSKVVKV
ncbi:MAG: 2-amino-4-hydroxy-6-hydroxymethyldihydropteridine diphosphokinase [Flavobacteriales bacterium]|nr:2-amino-4-hydroxy-6-hydroxymethyldihydropteridine diphosphokinase [Flavobacteriales bacterium]MBL6873195.1 2-amino-4-hydroxy-6-hydroxymethyldihydropteridine diphosphokinase [Flavobacteriales bacterium]